MDRKKQIKILVLSAVCLIITLLLALPFTLRGSLKNEPQKTGVTSEVDIANENASFSKQLDKDIENIDLNFQQLENDMSNIEAGINSSSE
jgi:hypothetical protein